LRFVLQAEAIRRGLGTYSITARKKNFWESLSQVNQRFDILAAALEIG
jgi:hypothetical protein